MNILAYLTVAITIKISFEENLHPGQIHRSKWGTFRPQKLQADRILEEVRKQQLYWQKELDEPRRPWEFTRVVEYKVEQS